MQPPRAIAPLPPSEIGQYRIARTLTPGQTFLGIDPGGREVVLKVLENDCLMRGQLHVSIHERLSRVRELAHIGVANLYGVERAGDRVYVVWEFIPGQPLVEYVKRFSFCDDFSKLAREIILTVEALHALGIVHGRIHSRNIIVTDRGQIRLTHISPLLYDDPLTDAHDLAEMLKQMAIDCGWADSQMAMIAGEETSSLARLRVRLANASDSPKGKAQGPANAIARAATTAGATAIESITASESSPQIRGPRRLLLLSAGIVLIASIALAWGILRWIEGSGAAKSIPPEAPAKAMQNDQR
jgi:serine/threonine protein kinase